MLFENLDEYSQLPQGRGRVGIEVRRRRIVLNRVVIVVRARKAMGGALEMRPASDERRLDLVHAGHRPADARGAARHSFEDRGAGLSVRDVCSRVRGPVRRRCGTGRNRQQPEENDAESLNEVARDGEPRLRSLFHTGNAVSTG